MIIVVGSINLDIIARVSGLPLPGQTVSGYAFTTAPGGKGANQALAAKRAGADVQMIGAIGDDANGVAATKLLCAAGVELNRLTVFQNETPTGVALILVDETSGENQIVVIAGANGALKPEQAKPHKIMPRDFLMLQMEIPAAINFAAINEARAAGAMSVLNIAPFNDEAVELAKLTDIIIANETEFDALAGAMCLAGNDLGARGAAFVAATGQTIIITLGAQGAIGVSRDGVFTAASPKIVPVDTVGAGDTFCGAFTVALSEGKGLAEAMHFGCAAGALACLRNGAQPAIPNRADIEALIGNL